MVNNSWIIYSVNIDCIQKNGHLKKCKGETSFGNINAQQNLGFQHVLVAMIFRNDCFITEPNVFKFPNFMSSLQWLHVFVGGVLWWTFALPTNQIDLMGLGYQVALLLNWMAKNIPPIEVCWGRFILSPLFLGEVGVLGSI